jgi:P4 family phage/plasmid primase-like protien
MAAIYPENIPPEAKNTTQWDCYKLEMVDGDKTKVPYNPTTGQRASSTDPQTWVAFTVALAAYRDLELYDGICFFVTEESGIVFIDLDKCIQDGIIAAWAAEIVKRFGSYTEKSQSGNGLHILINGKKPGKRCSTAKYPHGVEIYDHARQCCLTGDIIDGHAIIEARQEALDGLYREMFGDEQQKSTHARPGRRAELQDDALIEKAMHAKNGREFSALWNGSTDAYGGNHSSADMALMNMFAFWTGGDAAQMERLFSRSGLGQRAKWKDRQDYRERTIEKAISDAREFYEPPKDTDNGMTSEEILERIRADPRALKDPAVLAALANMKVNDPIEFDLLINAIKGVTKDVKPETIRKIVDKYIADANRAAAKAAEAKQREQHKKRDLGKLIRELDSEELTEGGNACRLERICGEEMRYCHTFKKWYLWDKGRWRVDSDGGAMRHAGGVVAALYVSAGQADGKDARDAMAGFAKETDTRKGLSNMLAIAANKLQFAITSEALDTDAWLLGAGDVTIDLKAGTIREPCREDLITKAIGTKYDKAAKCPGWLKFLDHIFHKDEKLIAYIKRAFGYCLTATMVEQVFFFCYGMGANGKSVFLAILRALLGEYAKQADFSTFLVQRNEKVRNDLAALAGARVIAATEAEEGSKLSMQVIKAWTGGDPITARFLFAENFTFKPAGKLWLAANTKPTISERNLAAWRRVQLIPFDVTIAKKDQDKELESKLLEELPGILNWALEGLQEYQQSGLDTPDVVKVATEKYREENDSMAAFLKECCDIQKLKVCKNRDLFKAYLNFCGMSGFKPLSQTKFSPELSNHPGITATRDQHGMTWIGIDLKKDWNPCRVEDNPTLIAGDSKHVGLPQNAQASSNPPTQGNLAQKPTYPAYPTSNEPIDNDLEKTNPTCNPVGGKGEDAPTSKNSGFEKFKANVQRWSRNTCRLCGQHFEDPLTIGYHGGGYICERCRRDGAPTEPPKADAQSKL